MAFSGPAEAWVLSLIWLNTKKRSKQKKIEMVINSSLGGDEDYRAARPGERRRKGGGIRDGVKESSQLSVPLRCLLFTADTLHRRRSGQEVNILLCICLYVCVCVCVCVS